MLVITALAITVGVIAAILSALTLIFGFARRREHRKFRQAAEGLMRSHFEYAKDMDRRPAFTRNPAALRTIRRFRIRKTSVVKPAQAYSPINVGVRCGRHAQLEWPRLLHGRLQVDVRMWALQPAESSHIAHDAYIDEYATVGV